MMVFGIVIGVLMVILGIYAAGVPFQTFLGIGWMLGALILIHGIEMVIRAFRQKKKDVLQGILGVLAAIGGLLILGNGIQRLLTDIAVIYLIGFYVIVYGIMEIVIGVKRLKEEKGISILKIVCGVLSVIAGIFVMMHPFMTMFSVGYLIAFSIVFQGIDIVLLSIHTGKKKEESE